MSVVKTTYAYSNNILKILDLEEDMTPYYLQTTVMTPVFKTLSLNVFERFGIV